VERTFGRFGRYRRLSKDHEHNLKGSEAWIDIAVIHRNVTLQPARREQGRPHKATQEREILTFETASFLRRSARLHRGWSGESHPRSSAVRTARIASSGGAHVPGISGCL
jgi:hypothetical protein